LSPSEFPTARSGRRPDELLDADGLADVVVDEIELGQALEGRRPGTGPVRRGAAVEDVLELAT
jgi:hypothetical protein